MLVAETLIFAAITILMLCSGTGQPGSGDACNCGQAQRWQRVLLRSGQTLRVGLGGAGVPAAGGGQGSRSQGAALFRETPAICSQGKHLRTQGQSPREGQHIE